MTRCFASLAAALALVAAVTDRVWAGAPTDHSTQSPLEWT